MEGLSKRYRIGSPEGPYRTFRETLMEAFRRPLRLRSDRDYIWALKDVSFEVQPGEVIGIIGRNGAGKSTLLKILSRITEPTEGWAEIRGRVGSLLEVGTGFHPELTGRENIYLNGAILGMRRQEIRRNFDQIVSFAELDKFIDTPVKRYSSGMYMRLAFSVAAHLEPEIMLVDEVLAVGDAGFQKKCLGKMGEVAKQGRTVLFVSHNMEAVVNLCDRAILLDKGEVVEEGSSESVVDHYLTSTFERGELTLFADNPEMDLCFISAKVDHVGVEKNGALYANRPLRFTVDYRVRKTLPGVQVVLHIYTMKGVHVLSTADIDVPKQFPVRQPGIYQAEVEVPAPLLAPGGYWVQLACGVPDFKLMDVREGVCFELRGEGTEFSTWSSGRRGTILNIILPWKTTKSAG